jgi:DNA-binding transcriptional LysR family regulator
MEIDQLTTFVAVATVGGFHRAAETLRVSQPAVSARIKALEDSLGSPLFARSRSGLTLTEAGRILRPFAEQLLKTAAQAFLPQLAVGREIRAGKLLAIKLLDAEPLGRSLDVIHPRQRPLRGQAQAFLRAIKEAAAANPAPIEGSRSQSRRRGK